MFCDHYFSIDASFSSDFLSSQKSLIFLQNAPFFLALWLFVEQFQMALEGFGIVKQQIHSYKINYYNSFSFLNPLWYFKLKILETKLIYTCQSFKIRLVLHIFFIPLKQNLWWCDRVFSYLKQVVHYLSAVEVLRKSIE